MSRARVYLLQFICSCYFSPVYARKVFNRTLVSLCSTSSILAHLTFIKSFVHPRGNKESHGKARHVDEETWFQVQPSQGYKQPRT
nr:hypothetical protein Q903MT_gene3037 [Picea sitchensis]